ncbi:MAG TPA: CpaF family protein [Phototrophicaceae bacterium]|nr:CpaF family protein [Phototrophicaceae bacterium]
MGSRLSRLNRPSGSEPGPSAPAPTPVAPPPVEAGPQPAPSSEYQIPPKKRTTPRIAALRKQLRGKLLASADEFDLMSSTNPEHQQMVRDRLKVVLERARVQLSTPELAELEAALIADLLGFGPLEPLVADIKCSEIMVNGPEVIFAEHKGKIRETECVFDDEDHIQWVAQRIVRPLQRDFSRNNPMVDARLPDGSRVHLIMPPSALQGTTMTIRKFPSKPLTIDDLIRFGSFTDEVAEFLQACVVGRLNIVVSGGTGSGKTTLLNVLSDFIPEDERIVTIEDSAELQLKQRHVVRLETCPPIPGGDGIEGRLVIRDLVKGSLRMRPDRIVVGECRSGEALDMLQAMNTGHDGSLTTIHSNSPRDCLARLETLVLMSGMDLPLPVIRRQIASAVHLVIQQSRLKDGSRKVIQITEIQGMEGDQITLQDIFVYQTPDHRGSGPSHAGGGTLNPTGFRPSFSDRLEEAGFKLSGRLFGSGANRFNKDKE